MKGGIGYFGKPGRHKVGLSIKLFGDGLNPAEDLRCDAGTFKGSSEGASINKPPGRCRDTCRRPDRKIHGISQNNQNFLRRPGACDTVVSRLPLSKGHTGHGNNRRVRVPLPPRCSCIEYTGILRDSWVPPRFRFELFFLSTHKPPSSAGSFRSFRKYVLATSMP